MGVKISSKVWNSIFAVPTTLVDDHIKMANGQQLKVFLYVLRHNTEGVDIQMISDGTGISGADVKDAMQYWISVGLLSYDGSFSEPIASQKIINNAVNNAVKASKEKTVVDLPDVIPTHEQVAARVLESPELAALYNEAQLKLGKTIGYDMQAKLLMIYDHYGLPVEVILTIIEYAVSQGKTGMAYIQKVAKDWAEKEIITLEAADEYMKQLQTVNRLWKRFENMFSTDRPRYTDKRATYLKKWNLEHKQSLELIYFACEETINNINKMSFEYMDKMLESWYKDKLKTPMDVMQFKKKPKEKVKTNSTSYDSNMYRERAQKPIEYKRKNS